jgi:hypothetical protein
LLVSVVAACGGGLGPDVGGGRAGSPSLLDTGGTGATGVGGQATGGTGNNGGAIYAISGGRTAGGAYTGGRNTGGVYAYTGGRNTGGVYAYTGGRNTGGVYAYTGGVYAYTGGVYANTGGAYTGGRYTGGAYTGGRYTGGASTGGTGACAAPVVPAGASLTGTTWTLTTNCSGCCTGQFTFNANGTMTSSCSYAGSLLWTQSGTTVVLYVNECYVTYTGTVGASSITGTAVNINGTTWTFTMIPY